jgi:hypothetical protein
MGEYPVNPLAVSLFGCVFALNTVVFIALHAYIARRLIKPEFAAMQDPQIIRKSFVGPVAYLLGAAAAWVSVHAAFVVYLLTPLFFIVPPQPRSERPAHAAATVRSP